MQDLPNEEQEWFQRKNEYRRSFMPKYNESELNFDEDLIDDTRMAIEVDDTRMAIEVDGQNVFVTDE
jgi:hypothetical protein